MKSNIPLLKTLLVAAAALSFCATPAWADDVVLTGDATTIYPSLSDTTATVGAANYVIDSSSDSGWIFVNQSAQTAPMQDYTTIVFESGTTFSGTGLFGIYFHQGYANATETVDLTNVDASNLTGQLCVENDYADPTIVRISGTTWSNVEYLFGDNGGAHQGNDSIYTLTLTDSTTFAGISGTTAGTGETITVETAGALLTLAGTGTYEYDGTLATSETRASLVMNSTGSGKQTFGGTNYLKDVTVTSGTLALGGTTDISGTVSVATDSTLDLSGTITLGSAISNSGSIVIEDDTTFVLDNLTQNYDSGSGNGYCQLIANDNGSITYTDGSISFSYDGNTIDWNLYKDESGNVYAYGEVGTLTWAGESSSNSWNYSDENWSVEGSGQNTAFVAGDSATFGEISGNISSTVNITTDIKAGSITVNDDYTFTTSNTEGVTVDAGGNLTVAENKTLTISEGVTLYIDEVEENFSVAGKIAGTGTIEIDLTGGSGNYGSTINLGEGNEFAGTVYIHAGDFTLNGSDIGNGTYELADGVGMQVTANTTITVANDFIIDGATDLHCNTNGGASSLTLTGSLTGSGTLTLAAGSGNALTITGDVDLGGFTLSTGATVTFANSGETTVKLGALTIASSGTVTFTNDATIAGNVAFTAASGEALVIGDGATLTVGGNLTDTDANKATNVHITLGEGSTLNVAGDMTFSPASFGSGYYSTITGQGAEKSTVITGSLTIGVLNDGSGVEIKDTTFITGGISFSNGTAKYYLYLDDVTLGFTKETVTIAAGGSDSAIELGDKSSSTETTDTPSTTVINTNLYADGAFTDTGVTVTIAEMIAGTGTLEVTGNGSLTLSGANTFSGGLTIKSGTVVSQNASALGTGDVKVSGGTLQVDVTTTTGAITFSDTGKLLVSQTLLATAGDLEDGQTASVAIISSSTITFGDVSLSEGDVSEDVAGWAAAQAGQYVITGWTYDGGTLYAIVAIPEPSMFGMMFGLGALGLVATRRRRRAA